MDEVGEKHGNYARADNGRKSKERKESNAAELDRRVREIAERERRDNAVTVRNVDPATLRPPPAAKPPQGRPLVSEEDLMAVQRTYQDRTCKECGDEYPPTSPRQEFCRVDCRETFQARERAEAREAARLERAPEPDLEPVAPETGFHGTSVHPEQAPPEEPTGGFTIGVVNPEAGDSADLADTQNSPEPEPAKHAGFVANDVWAHDVGLRYVELLFEVAGERGLDAELRIVALSQLERVAAAL